MVREVGCEPTQPFTPQSQLEEDGVSFYVPEESHSQLRGKGGDVLGRVSVYVHQGNRAQVCCQPAAALPCAMQACPPLHEPACNSLCGWGTGLLHGCPCATAQLSWMRWQPGGWVAWPPETAAALWLAPACAECSACLPGQRGHR